MGGSKKGKWKVVRGGAGQKARARLVEWPPRPADLSQEMRMRVQLAVRVGELAGDGGLSVHEIHRNVLLMSEEHGMDMVRAWAGALMDCLACRRALPFDTRHACKRCLVDLSRRYPEIFS